jgi:anti-sigma regulatory factor (Ser/Thr protein kinase)
MRAEGTYEARLLSFAEVRALAEAFGQTAGAGHEATIRVVLVLEELFTNTVAHGYPPGGEGRVWVALALTGNAIEITYEDAAPPFDPFGAPAGAARSVAERPVGGVGLALVRGLSATRRYARVGDRNRVVLTVALGASAASPPHGP